MGNVSRIKLHVENLLFCSLWCQLVPFSFNTHRLFFRHILRVKCRTFRSLSHGLVIHMVPSFSSDSDTSLISFKLVTYVRLLVTFSIDLTNSFRPPMSYSSLCFTGVDFFHCLSCVQYKYQIQSLLDFDVISGSVIMYMWPRIFLEIIVKGNRLVLAPGFV